MEAKRYVVVMAIALLAVNAAILAAGCIPDKLKPDGWWWEGDPYPARVQKMKAPDAVAVGERTTIKSVVWIGRKRKVVEEAVDVVEATRTVRIQLMLRAYGDYSITPANIPPPVEKSYTVSFPIPGEWTVEFNDKTTDIIVYGDWIGEERLAQVLDFDLTPYCYASRSNPLCVTVKHEGGDWFYFGSPTRQDSEERRLELEILERRAESDYFAEQWKETAEIPLTFPDAGTWRVKISDNLFADRVVKEGEGSSSGMSYYDSFGDGSLDLPEDIALEEGVRAEEETQLIVYYTEYPPQSIIVGVDFELIPEEMKLDCKLWSGGFHTGQAGEGFPQEFFFNLVFPLPGEWTITFDASKGLPYEEPREPFVKTITVLPGPGA